MYNALHEGFLLAAPDSLSCFAKPRDEVSSEEKLFKQLI